jgi:phosphoribosylglycinamide formyltransferase-1
MAQLNAKTKLKLGVLISGRGSNLQALIDAAADPSFPAEIALVISNRAEAGGLARAEIAGIATRVIPHKEFVSREAFDAALDRALRDAGVELVCLAGFMRLLSAGFSESWHDRLINIHPSLLPSFKGLDSHAQALRAGVRFSGCTVHFVRPEMDAGPIIVQAAVPVHDDDDLDTLAARILEAEHKSYPLAVRLIAEGRVKVVDGIVRIADGAFATDTLLNPRG